MSDAPIPAVSAPIADAASSVAPEIVKEKSLIPYAIGGMVIVAVVFYILVRMESVRKSYETKT